MLFLALIHTDSFPVSVKALASIVNKGTLWRNSNLWVVNVEERLSQIKINIVCVYSVRKKNNSNSTF